MQISATRIQRRRIAAGPGAGGVHRARRADRLRQVRDEDRDEQADADALARREPDAEDGLLGDAVEEGAEREGGAGAARAAAAARGAAPPDDAVEREVGDRPGGEADRDEAGVAEPRALLREVEAHAR